MKLLLELLYAFIAPTTRNYLNDSDPKTARIVVGAVFVVTAVVILAGVFVNAPTAILVAAAGALVAVIAVFWSSLRTLLGETPLSAADAFVFSTPPRAEEEQKRAVLRALKDIEFERNVGKISEEDYAQLVAKYRAEAKQLLQKIDEKSSAGRERAEVLVQRKLRQSGLAEPGADDKPAADDETETNADEDSDEPAAEETATAASAAAAVAMIAATKRPVSSKKKKAKKKPAFEVIDASAASSACAKCSTTNDKDAVFCKKCGTRVGKSEEETDEEANAS